MNSVLKNKNDFILYLWENNILGTQFSVASASFFFFMWVSNLL